MKRRYRVRDSERFQEIRRSERSYSNRLLVLCILSNALPYSRFGFSVSRHVGNAVARNRVKRRMREVVRLRMRQIQSGWDCVWIARTPIRDATYREIEVACSRLLRRASLFVSEQDLRIDRKMLDACQSKNPDAESCWEQDRA